MLSLPHHALKSDIVVRVGFRPGMTHLKTRLLDQLWSALTKIKRQNAWVYYWIGSDILYAARDRAQGMVTKHFSSSSSAIHLVGAPWFMAELEEIGISAKEALFPLELPEAFDVKPFDHRRSALTYIPDDRPEFYGGELLVRLAEDFPEVLFDVVGGWGSWLKEELPNIEFHGWVDGIYPFLEENPIVLRLVAHDALGGTVREALAYGCHVIYTFNVPHVRSVPFGEYLALRDAFKVLVESDRAGELQPNIQGSKYARAEWDPRKLTRRLVRILNESAERGAWPPRDPGEVS